MKGALVTGGTGGIGTAICRALARKDIRVVASYNKSGDHEMALAWQRQQKIDGYDIGIVYGNICDFNSTVDMINAAEGILGTIDVLVNNAGITSDTTLRKMLPEQWLSVLQTNLTSVFNVTRNIVNGMIERRYGRIINISSVNGQKGQFGQANYCAAKAGIHGFTKALAQEVAKNGVTVNTVSPGYVKTKMVERIPEQVLASIVEKIPVGRLAEPDEVAHVVAFLAAEEAAFITGANIAINGGQHMY